MEFVDYIEQNQAMLVWLAFGVALFLAELIGPGIGLMFAGMGALTVGMLINFSIIPAEGSWLLQGVIFFSSALLWTLILWKPMQKFRLGRKKEAYSNMVGDKAVVAAKGLTKEHNGEVIWSGTIMKAKLAENSSTDELKEGTEVTIKSVSGNILTVSDK